MTGFTADWLALREPADRRARSRELVRDLTAWRRDLSGLAVVDLGAGTGAAMRYLAPRLGGEQSWLLLDHDAALLKLVAARTGDWARENGWRLEATATGLRVTGTDLELFIRTQTIDLGHDLEPLGFASNGLVTASALLDLVSAPWLTALAARCRVLGAAFHASLVYDGRVTLSPALPFDQTVRDLVNRHQASDKGFGTALGPAASEAAGRTFADRGYAVQATPSDWCLDFQDEALLAWLYRGWAEASTDLRPDLSGRIDSWLEQRLELRRDPRTRTMVGHRDLLALPRAGDR